MTDLQEETDTATKNDLLKNYLLNEWRRSVHPRYQKYFNEWYQNLTPLQVDFFNAYSKGLKTIQTQ